MTTETAPLPAWIYRQSAALPYRWRDGELQVLLVTSRSGRRWVAPKGIVEPGLTPAASAASEAREEAGVAGDIANTPLGSYKYDKWGGTCEVAVFPLRVRLELEDWPESEMRRRAWLAVPAACEALENPGLCALVERLPDVAEPASEMGSGPLIQAETPRLIYLLRHAEAERQRAGVDDFDRPLSERGENAFPGLQRYFRKASVAPDLVWCSPAKRARQTLDGVLPVLGAPIVRHDRDLYLASADALLATLLKSPDEPRRLMIVGHNPGVRSLAARLAVGAGDRLDTFPAGGFAILVFSGAGWPDLDDGACELHSLAGPDDIRVARADGGAI